MDIFIGKRQTRYFTLAGINVSVRWLQIILLVGLFLVALLPRVFGLDAFLTADEDDQIMFAHLFLKSALQGDWAGALVLGYPGVPTLILGGLGVGLRYVAHYQGWLPLSWVEADLMTTIDQATVHFGTFEYPLDFILWVRFPMAVLAALSIVGIFLLMRELVDQHVAILATLVIAFNPFILAHSRVIHVDAPLSYFMFLSFLAFMLYLDRGVWHWLLLSGLFGGLAGLSKTPAALLGPILLTAGLLYALLPRHETPRWMLWRRLFVALLGWGLIALAAFSALWPAMWSEPTKIIDFLIQNVQSVNSMAHPTTGVFWGDYQTDQSPLYYVIVFPYHLTVLSTIGLVAGLGLIAAGVIMRWRGLQTWASEQLPLVLSLVAYIVVFIGPVSLISRRGDRYILPVYFASGLLAALALYWLAMFLRKALSRINLTPTRLVGAGILIQIFFVLLYHPYYLAYFNPVAAHYAPAPARINIGWGEGLDQAARYLNQITGPEKPQVAAWYSNQFAPYYHGRTTDLSDQSSALTEDYTVFYINQVQRGFPSAEILDYYWQRDPIHVVTLGGIEYAWIYEGPVISQELPEPHLYRFSVDRLLGGGAHLIGIDVPQDTMPVDAFSTPPDNNQALSIAHNGQAITGIPVTLYWETIAKIHGEHNIYIALVDDAGHVWGQVDRMILAGMWRPDRWHTGYTLRDEYKLPVDAGTPPGTYHLEVGMYDFVTGQSYGVVKNIGEITLTPPETLPQPEALPLEALTTQPINETFKLVGHTYTGAEYPPGAEVWGKIFWQATASLPADYTLQFSLLAPQEQYLVSAEPLSPRYAPTAWRPGEAVGVGYRFRVPAFALAGTYPLQATVLNADGKPVGPAVTLSKLTVKATTRNFELPANVTPISAYISDEIELVGYNLIDHTVEPRDSFGLKLYWRSVNPAESNYTVFVHVVGPDEVMRGQWDSVPMQGQAPTSGWLPGEIIEDTYEVPMSRDAPPWKYDIFVGMYDPLTGERLPVSNANAVISDNRVWLTRVQVVDAD